MFVMSGYLRERYRPRGPFRGGGGMCVWGGGRIFLKEFNPFLRKQTIFERNHGNLRTIRLGLLDLLNLDALG